MALPPSSARRSSLSPAHNATPIPRPLLIPPPTLLANPGRQSRRHWNPQDLDHRRSKTTLTSSVPNSRHPPRSEQTGSAARTATHARAVACLSPKTSASSWIRAHRAAVMLGPVTAARFYDRAKSSTPAATTTLTTTTIPQIPTLTPRRQIPYAPPQSPPMRHHVTPIL